MSEPTIVADGEFAGWKAWAHDAFENRAGPFYFRDDVSADGRQADESGVVCAFRAEQRHMNGGGFMHGGCLMTFADFALFSIAHREMAGQWGVTLNLAADFLTAARAGQLIEARGEVTRGGGKTVFVRGLVIADGTPALSFTGIIRKVSRP